MQNAFQSTANYDQHNAWYNSIFSTEIKPDPDANPISQQITPPPAAPPTSNNTHSQLEQYLKHQQHLSAAIDTSSAMTPSPHNNDSLHFFDTKMHQQLLQQQQYQQQFRQAQHAAAAAAAAAAQHNQMTNASTTTHLPLGFNPLTPPGLPMNTLPQFYNTNNNNNNNNNNSNSNNNMHHNGPPQQCTTQLQLNTPLDINQYEKLQSALTPRNTPPMDVTPSKDTTNQQQHHQIKQEPMPQLPQTHQDATEVDKDNDAMSNSSEDVINIAQDEAKYYESIHVPRYNSHGKLRTYPCKSCPQLYDTKAEYWEHLLTHMKPEKILRCPMYPKCPFVTEYKHFLDFHLKKHRNQKPFKCPEGGCKYSCETKGMLTSHLKSHSDVYPYKCGDCDYAVKFIHSFKQHLRKYDHKPGLVLDDKGKPNPAAVIDVYGRRRGPKSKGGNASNSGGLKRERSNTKSTNVATHLSSALQGIKMAFQTRQELQEQQEQSMSMCVSPAKSTCSTTTADLSATQQHQREQQREHQQQQQLNNFQQQQQHLSNILPPLASILQQTNTNMAFFPYWNLNLQMLAAQQQAVVLAQLSPRKRELALQQLQKQQDMQQQQHGNVIGADSDDDDDDDVDCKSVDSAMDLSQSAEEEQQQQQHQRTPEISSTAVNLKQLREDINNVETPISSSLSSLKRKGRVLQLDALLQVQSAATESKTSKMTNVAVVAAVNKVAASASTATATVERNARFAELASSSMENANDALVGNGGNTSASSTSNDSGTATSSECDVDAEPEPFVATKPASAVHECKYCDIYFKDPVLYTIHMGYHSCDDVFKCNMCGEKCDGPVGLFVHMARNAHA